MNLAATDRLSFAAGLRVLPQACAVLWRIPRVVLWLLPPLLITLGLNVLAFYLGFGWVQGLLDGFFAGDGWLRGGFEFIGAALVVLVLGWMFIWVFLAVAGPFQDFISVAVEREVRGFSGPDPAGLRGFFRSLGKSLVQALGFLLLTLVFLVLALVPVAGQVLVFLWGAFSLGYAFATIPSGRMAQRLRDRVAFFRRHIRGVMGLGCVISLVSLVPVLNVLFLPVFVVAGTLLYLEGQRLAGRAEETSRFPGFGRSAS